MKAIFSSLLVATAAALTSPLAFAIPITSGSFELDVTTLSQSFEIDANDFDNLSLEFSVIGGGSIDPCVGRGNSDCLAVTIAGTSLVDNLNITNSFQDFGPYSLPLANAIFDLTFESTITGTDESMTVLWDIVGEVIPRVTQAAEPLTLSLFGLGLAALGFARRKRA